MKNIKRAFVLENDEWIMDSNHVLAGGVEILLNKKRIKNTVVGIVLRGEIMVD